MTHIVDFDELIDMQAGYVNAIKSYSLPEDAEELEIAERDLATLVDIKDRVATTTITTSSIRAALFDELAREIEADIEQAVRKRHDMIAVGYQVIQTRCIERAKQETSQP